MDNRTLIRSGKARLVGWSRQLLYLGYSVLPRSVFWSADSNGRWDNLDVMCLNQLPASAMDKDLINSKKTKGPVSYTHLTLPTKA